MSMANDSRHGGKGEDIPSELEFSGGDDEEEDEGEVTPPPILHCARLFPHLVTSSVDRRGS
jgi:hypothetical protein